MVETLMDKVDDMTSQVMQKRRFVAMTPFEKVTLIVIAMALIILMSAAVFTRNQVTTTNAMISEVKAQTATIVVENQILQQKIDDLSTYEHIVTVAQQYGLKKNQDNVRTVTK